jgi:secreted PhoX family phosphatase
MSTHKEKQGLSSSSQNDTSDFTRLVDMALSRRQFLTAGAAVGMAGFFAINPLAKAVADTMKATRFPFDNLPATTADTITLPPGYRWQSLISWGDPLFDNTPEFDPSGKAEAASQALQFGDNNDGMSFFPLTDDSGVLAVNNEYTNYEYLFEAADKSLTADDVRKAQNAHGVSIVEVRRDVKGQWSPVLNSRYNRRIHAHTEMQLTGPAAGHTLLKTEADPSGASVLGTLNNCANGMTPWGTYLTCEENFNGYFGTLVKRAETPDEKRYGIAAASAGYNWHLQDSRFDFGKNPQEANRFGWVVEIDPLNPDSVPLKRTALGRFKHENAELTINADGHVVVYLGDDERGEHLYRFVSAGRYNPDKPEANRNLLDEGTLSVARFSLDAGKTEGTGEWIDLTHGKHGLTAANGFADQAAVLVFARRAATQVGGTTMDRPEWVAVHPSGKQVYCTLTNNKNRGQDGQPVGGPNPRAKNNYGQIVRWMPANGDHTAASFTWDLYVIAGNPTLAKDQYGGSSNVTADNMFNSPDGIAFDDSGMLWIQTDGNYSNAGEFAGMGNNQMLLGDPETGEIRRFMVGPVACEVTGLVYSPDKKSLFVGIQHPGEELQPSHFPAGGDSKPRSTVIVISREDGGTILG